MFSRFDLDLKPLQSTSTTRAWRSHRSSYKITVRNYLKYSEIAFNNTDFPALPDLNFLKQMTEYQIKFCELFDILESHSCDLSTGISVYFQLYYLAIEETTPDSIKNTLMKFLSDEKTGSFKNACFSDYAMTFIYLSKISLKGNIKFS